MSQANAATLRPMPNQSALRGATAWRGSGRWRVRRMTSSMSRSTYMLIAFAPPAARVPPTMTAATSHSDGTPRSASTMVGTVVTSSSSMMRGFMSATYACRVASGPVSSRALRAPTASSEGLRRRVVSSSQTDAPHSAAPTARCGTTKNAERRDTTLSPPSAICTTTSTTIQVARRRASGASVDRHSATAVQATRPATTRLRAR